MVTHGHSPAHPHQVFRAPRGLPHPYRGRFVRRPETRSRTVPASGLGELPSLSLPPPLPLPPCSPERRGPLRPAPTRGPGSRTLSSAPRRPRLPPDSGRGLRPPVGAWPGSPALLPSSTVPPSSSHPPRGTFSKSRPSSPPPVGGPRRPTPKSAAQHLSPPRPAPHGGSSQRVGERAGKGGAGGGPPLPPPGWPDCRPRGSRGSSCVHLSPEQTPGA